MACEDPCRNLICPVHEPERYARVMERLASQPPDDPGDDLLPGSISCGGLDEDI